MYHFNLYLFLPFFHKTFHIMHFDITKSQRVSATRGRCLAWHHVGAGRVVVAVSGVRGSGAGGSSSEKHGVGTGGILARESPGPRVSLH